MLTHNELQIRAIQTLWEQHLQEALKDWETQYATITQVPGHLTRTLTSTVYSKHFTLTYHLSLLSLMLGTKDDADVSVHHERQ